MYPLIYQLILNRGWAPMAPDQARSEIMVPMSLSETWPSTHQWIHDPIRFWGQILARLANVDEVLRSGWNTDQQQMWHCEISYLRQVVLFLALPCACESFRGGEMKSGSDMLSLRSQYGQQWVVDILMT